MKRFTLSLLFLLCISSMSIAQGIQFEKGTWEEAKAKAKSQNKHLFVDAYTTWCGPCKWLAANVFTDAQVGKFFSENFIAVKLDMEDKGEGTAFAKQYQVRAYPTLVYFNPQGEMVHKMVGAAPADMFLATSKDALNPDKQFFTLKKKFDGGQKDQALLANLATASASAGEDGSVFLNEYLNNEPKDKWTSSTNWALISKSLTDIKSPHFAYINENEKTFVAAVGQKQYDQYCNMVVDRYLGSVLNKKPDAAKIEEANKFLASSFPKNAPKYSAKLNYYFNARNNDSHTYAKNYFGKYCDNANELNSIAWSYYETKTDAKQLKDALKWADKSIKLERMYMNLDTKAHLQYKMGDSKGALATAKEALIQANNEKQDPKETQDLIKKIEGEKK